MAQKIRQFRSDEEGQGLIEYVLIIALVAIIIISALLLFSGALTDYYNVIGNDLNSAMGG